MHRDPDLDPDMQSERWQREAELRRSLRGLLDEAFALLYQEARGVVQDVAQAFGKGRGRIAGLIVGLAAGFCAVIALLTALILAAATVLPPWAAALAVTLVLGAISAVLLRPRRRPALTAALKQRFAARKDVILPRTM